MFQLFINYTNYFMLPKLSHHSIQRVIIYSVKELNTYIYIYIERWNISHPHQYFTVLSTSDTEAI